MGSLGSVDHVVGIPTSSKGNRGGSENCGQAEMGGINSAVGIREGFPSLLDLYYSRHAVFVKNSTIICKPSYK